MSTLGGSATSAGITVDENKALGLSTIWSIIERISSTMGVFPLKIYETNNLNQNEIVKQHPLSKLLTVSPNNYMTAFDWRYIMMSNELLYGAGISEIEFDCHGFPKALHPIATNKVEPVFKDYKLTYKITPDTGKPRILQPHQVLVFRFWPEINGSWKSPIKIHKETIGSALAVRNFGSMIFGSGCNPAGIIKGIRQGLSEDAKKTLLERFQGYAGLGSSHKLMMLEQGEDFERVGLPPEDAQYLETRKFDVEEISRIYNVPLFLLNAMTQSTSWGSGLETLSKTFISFVMMPHVLRWEQEINKKLISVDNENQYVKFNMSGMLRSNDTDRWNAYRQASYLGVLSIDEIRQLEELNELPNGEGKTRLVPVNMTPLTKAINKDN
jgi:HK97 family phage portal protein